VGVAAIWLEQFDCLDEHSVFSLKQRWPGVIYVKALDGLQWMASCDRSPLAVRHAWGRLPYWTWRERGWQPWTVPRGIDADREGRLTGQLAEEAGSVILDLSAPGETQLGNAARAARFLRGYGEETAVPWQVRIDPGRLAEGFPPAGFLTGAAKLLLQVAWPVDSPAWEEALRAAEAAAQPCGKAREYVLPGEAEPETLRAAVAWCRARGAPVSLWAWGCLRPENWP
jgi:hypothetical protein